ncbi:hypothetical protein K3725_00435 [Leisingera sp. S132]|uniref:hypothetical protein n=1 Tax=Leisingera sp. S132 TaxID=2867016 RepID=UPI0021A36795|nr:hypothetical protein [Leisingera sp. S132]UWQ79511.1 hypothetical protein K3725_00435 [Leisingera sp. S132]
MKRNAPYYLSRLEAKADSYFEENVETLSGEAFLEAYDLFSEQFSRQALSARIGEHLNEAVAIIRALLDDPEPTEPEKIYDFLWVDRVSNLMGKGELMQAKLTRAEMLERLHWITSEEFGEDLDEWADWMAAFEANPPAWGYR